MASSIAKYTLVFANSMSVVITKQIIGKVDSGIYLKHTGHQDLGVQGGGEVDVLRGCATQHDTRLSFLRRISKFSKSQSQK
jgi:hypothetical protein